MTRKSFRLGATVAVALVGTPIFASEGERAPVITGNVLTERPAMASGLDAPGCPATKQMAQYTATEHEELIAALFTQDAVWLAPTGTVWQGREAIAAGLAHGKAMAAMHPLMAHVPFAITGNGHECFTELALEMPQGGGFRVASVTHTTENASGQIVRAMSFLRPRPAEAAAPSGPK